MRVLPFRLEAEVTDAQGTRVEVADLEGSGRAFGLGPIEVTIELHDTGLDWSVANRGDRTVRVRSVSLVYGVAGARGPVRMLRHGYQSWSPSSVAVLGEDVDPSTLADLPFLQAVHHADQRTARSGELRSEWVTVLADGPDATDAAVLLGFEGGDRHDGTLRLAPGDAELAAGAHRELHPLVVEHGRVADASPMLERWAERVGRVGGARVDAPYQVGWCSWYQYFHDVTEADITANLARADQWPFEVFQVDDGFQAAVGDWLETNDRFPSDLSGLASSIRASGRTPGLWLAPFLVAPDSEVAAMHPDWIARHVVDGVDTGPLRTWWNPPWGGGEDGFMYGLDTTHPDVAAHLEAVAAAVVDAGFPYLKLDFTFSPAADGGYADPSRTPAERVRAGFQSIRRGVRATTPSSSGAACPWPTWSDWSTPTGSARTSPPSGRWSRRTRWWPATSAASRPPPTPSPTR